MSTHPFPAADLPMQAIGLLDRARTRSPRVHCLMNTVVQKLVADGLSALGAIPSMTSSTEEVQAFVGKADALVVNLGTLDAQRREAIGLALDAAEEGGKPWVLDPAHCDYSALRSAFAQELLARSPTILRANAAEHRLLQVPAGVVGVRTGEKDRIESGATTLLIGNGHPFMAKVTGTGCLSGAVIAAFTAVGDDPFIAAASAMLAMGIAAEIAARDAPGPASFGIALLDVLSGLTEADIIQNARLRNA
jgi:hydroxyethylthiazole kinase